LASLRGGASWAKRARGRWSASAAPGESAVGDAYRRRRLSTFAITRGAAPGSVIAAPNSAAKPISCSSIGGKVAGLSVGFLQHIDRQHGLYQATMLKQPRRPRPTRSVSLVEPAPHRHQHDAHSSSVRCRFVGKARSGRDCGAWRSRRLLAAGSPPGLAAASLATCSSCSRQYARSARAELGARRRAWRNRWSRRSSSSGSENHRNTRRSARFGLRHQTATLVPSSCVFDVTRSS